MENIPVGTDSMAEGVEVLGVRVDAIDDQGLNGEIARIIDEKGHAYFAYVNINAINIAQDNATFRDFLNEAPIVYCDGEGVRLGARILGVRLPPRIVLTYWIWDLCAMCEQRGYSIYLLGGHDHIVRAAAANLKKAFPRLTIAGLRDGYFKKTGEESAQAIAQVNAARPNILFVCFGMPLQEEWVRANFQNLHANMILFGGSTIDYAAGAKRVAPVWMRSAGLEWLFRLMQEPRRLWKRYLLGNPLFMGRILLQRIRGRRR